MWAERLVVLLSLLSLLPAGWTQRSCSDLEICTSKKLCLQTDDSGRGLLGTRILYRSCGRELVCCEKEQLENFYAEEAEVEYRSQRKGYPWVGTTAATSTKPETTTTEIAVTDPSEPEDYKSCGEQRLCVPRHLCTTGSVNMDGRYVITARINEASNFGCRSVEICCPENEQIEEGQSRMQQNLKDFEYRGCGYSNSKGLYYQLDGYNDGESTFAEFPWMVALMDMEGNYICGGSLIHPQMVLTSAHNVANYSEDSLLARAGDWDLNSQREPHPYQMRRIRQLYRHEAFNKLTHSHDMALMVLERPFQLAPHIQPICLPPAETTQVQEDMRRAHCLATGWGQSNSSAKSMEHLLKRIELPVVEHENCQRLLRRTILGRRFRLHDSFLCAGGVEGKDTCKGDGGSPLFCSMPGQTDRYQLAGIVSWGIECAEKDIPAAYTNVAYLRDWINQMVVQAGFSLNDLV
ncbi:phenoloxidase-activating factor 2 [Drosophila pseudoobscura]|uniref:Phenoloxidase-activating factor 2 n=1 Tax=Drosophila pseudoobscura pseudoobscura TaxID=46245 RepID=A0A6I8VFT1_DROPS|nr:phenoloxidase-activating factor 2 [Drosophila pseudoobscura]XP_033234029.1 phenoloxidase-activating factor 2 [Drosophila pseudoobscura]